MKLAFFGSSLVSSYWNGACTYYRGIVRALHNRGHEVTFYEPDAYERQAHRDIADPAYATVVVYDPAQAREVMRAARGFDVVVKTSGVGIGDEVLEKAALEQDGMHVFWDVDAPATLASMEAEAASPLRALIPDYDLIFTYGGGDRVVARYAALGARRCVTIYNALDPAAHHPVAPDPRFEADLGFLGNRLPDREERVEDFFFSVAEWLPSRAFVLGGNGWEARARGLNLRYLGHVGTAEHNAFNSTPLAVLNVSRESMARNGFSPATRVFEAAGAGACLISDAWEGVEQFLTPGSELLIAHDGQEVSALLGELDRDRAAIIGAAARERVLNEHTYAQRAELVERTLEVAG